MSNAMHMLEAGKNYEFTIDKVGGALGAQLSKSAGDKIQITNVVAAASASGAFDFEIDGVPHHTTGIFAPPFAWAMEPDDDTTNGRHPDDHGGTGNPSVYWFYDAGQSPPLQLAFNAADENNANHGVYYLKDQVELPAAGATGDPFVTPMLQ